MPAAAGGCWLSQQNRGLRRPGSFRLNARQPVERAYTALLQQVNAGKAADMDGVLTGYQSGATPPYL